MTKREAERVVSALDEYLQAKRKLKDWSWGDADAVEKTRLARDRLINALLDAWAE